MITPTAARRLRRSVPAALLSAVLLAGVLPLPGTTASTSVPGAPIAASIAAQTQAGAAIPAVVEAAPVAAAAPPVFDPNTATAPGIGQQPSTAYEEWLAHEHDRIDFTPGARVTIGFTPRTGDRWPVGGRAPTALPAGQASGQAMATARQGSVWAGPVAGGAGAGAAGASPAPVPSASAGVTAPVDAPAGLPSVDAQASSWQATAAGATVAPAAATGLRRQVFGFLPYWEVSGASSRLNYSVLSTIAYFSVGADAAGNLRKRNSDGSLTTGWGGWTSSSMTSVINNAHAHGTRVVLTVSVFAWSSGGANLQAALLGSSTARLNLARQLAAAVRDRGADGVNLDFEPLVSGREAGFVAFIRTLRAQLNAIRPGYQITYDTTGYIGNYPLEASVGAAAADAIFIMGYDYRTDGASTSGSIDPLSGPGYDLADTVRAYTARVAPSRVILGIPWYGRAWSTTSSSPRAANQSSAKFGYSTPVNYENIPALVAQYGSHWDTVEQSPYIAYRRQNCTSTYGCVTSWRQVWYDNAVSLGRRYQLVNDYGLRGAGMWALGYDGAYPEMYRALSDAFLVDHSAPQAGVRMLPATSTDEGFVVTWSAADVSAVTSYDVGVSVDGGAWRAWDTATTRTSDVWLGGDGHSYAFRVRATDSHGNIGPWNVTSTAAPAAVTPSGLAVGGFGRVTLDGLAYRTGPSTSAGLLGPLAAGTIVALTSGPVSAGGYIWYEVTQPIREWATVSFVERGVWIAVRSSSAVYVVPFHAPNVTVVDAGIAGFDFANGGATGTSAAAVLARTFSPNGDGRRDGLRIVWTNTVALGGLTLNVLRLNGSTVGSVPVTGLTAGAHAWTWNGTAGGSRVPDGRYLLQLVGTAGSRTYRAPSASPATPAQIAAFAVTVDTVPPAVASASASSTLISPNGDGLRETTAYRLSAPTATTWTVGIVNAGGNRVRSATGSGGALAFTWNGRNDAGAVVPDGRYTVTLAACDAAGNCATRAYAVTVDTTAPTITTTIAPAAFSPNGDGIADTAAMSWSSTERVTGTARVWRGTTLVRSWAITTAATGAVTWDGRNAAGAAAADGRYTFRVDARDLAGNRTVAATGVIVDRTARSLHWSANFYPQDGDALAATSTLSWTLIRTATTTLALYDAQGHLVRTVWANRVLAAGARAWAWNGRLADGTFAPQGSYAARLTVVSPYSTMTLVRPVWAAAFPATLSATTVSPGRVLTVSFSTTEALRTGPTVTFRQRGLTAVTVAATRLANGTYVARFTVRPGGAGAASIRIAATDTGGRPNATVLAVAVAS